MILATCGFASSGDSLYHVIINKTNVRGAIYANLVKNFHSLVALGYCSIVLICCAVS